ncbi:MAG: L-glutamine synthetase [Candidatus Aminicenantes bacterium]|nr:L-glutamine synthetase [Candidatus Aminicenantes bacterium]
MGTPAVNYALANPVSILLDKPASDFQREDLIRLIERNRIERITFHYTALDGKLKELKIPVADARYAEMILAEGERVDGSSLFKGIVDMGTSDLYVIPLYRTAFLNPFDEGSLDFVCRFMTREGNPAPFALDSILGRACALFRADTGLEFNALGELEFYLLGDSGANLFRASKQRNYHASAPFFKSGPILNEILQHITRITGAVKYAHGEVGFVDSVKSDSDEIKGKRAEQLEVEYLPRPADEMGDILVLGRWIIRNVALKHGCVATFTPKIEEGVAGSGLHFHMELLKNGRNIMTGPAGAISEAARRLIGGVCEYADSLTAFGNTVSSAYLRLVPNQEAPTRICWSDLNRSAMIRVPLGWSSIKGLARKINPQEKTDVADAPGRQTVELRSPDGSALIHLVLAGLVMAADWAFSGNPSLFRERDPLDLAEKYYVKGNVFKEAALLDKLPKLPTSCVESSRILLKKRELYERDDVFPGGIIDYVARLLEKEDDEFMNKKLADLPADDRLHEIRKIMHKDLHRH